jgi:hypothetical protein
MKIDISFVAAFLLIGTDLLARASVIALDESDQEVGTSNSIQSKSK